MTNFRHFVWILSLNACISVPGTRRHAFNIVPEGEERKMGDEAFAELLGKEKISNDESLKKVLARVGQRISHVVPVKDYEWRFALLESPEKNAFCLPGGKVAFYTGIIPALENEAAMALVMGHEVGHAVARHAAQRISQALAIQLGLAVVDSTVMRDSENRGVVMGALGLGAQFGVLMPFSRRDENEADEMGLKYAAQAGYDPAEGPRFWKRFSKATAAQGKAPEWLSTHPSDEKRIAHLKELQSASLKLYEKSSRYGLGEWLIKTSHTRPLSAR